jgi:hypothetical protein
LRAFPALRLRDKMKIPLTNGPKKYKVHLTALNLIS